VVYDLQEKKSKSVALPWPAGAKPQHKSLLYGSIARDLAGRFYLVGTAKRYKTPLIFQIQVR